MRALLLNLVVEALVHLKRHVVTLNRAQLRLCRLFCTQELLFFLFECLTVTVAFLLQNMRLTLQFSLP